MSGFFSRVCPSRPVYGVADPLGCLVWDGSYKTLGSPQLPVCPSIRYLSWVCICVSSKCFVFQLCLSAQCFQLLLAPISNANNFFLTWQMRTWNFTLLVEFAIIWTEMDLMNHLDQFPAPQIQTCMLFLFSRSLMSDSLQPRGLQHARPPCLSPSSGVCSDSCSSSWSLVNQGILCRSLLLLLSVFPASGSFPMSRLFASCD